MHAFLSNLAHRLTDERAPQLEGVVCPQRLRLVIVIADYQRCSHRCSQGQKLKAKAEIKASTLKTMAWTFEAKAFICITARAEIYAVRLTA